MPAEPWALPRGECLPLPEIAAIRAARWARQAAYVAEASEFYRDLWRERAPDPRLEALAELHERGLRLAVASNKPARFSRPILERLGLLAFIDCVMGPDIVGSAKPDPTMLRRCLETLRVEAAASVYVGDMVLDVETAVRARVPVVLVTGGSSSSEDLRATGLPVVGSLDELCGLLDPRR